MSGVSGVSGSAGTTGYSGYSDATIFYTGSNIKDGYSSILNHTSDGVNRYDGTGTSGFGNVSTSNKANKYTLSSVK